MGELRCGARLLLPDDELHCSRPAEHYRPYTPATWHRDDSDPSRTWGERAEGALCSVQLWPEQGPPELCVGRARHHGPHGNHEGLRWSDEQAAVASLERLRGEEHREGPPAPNGALEAAQGRGVAYLHDGQGFRGVLELREDVVVVHQLDVRNPVWLEDQRAPEPVPGVVVVPWRSVHYVVMAGG